MEWYVSRYNNENTAAIIKSKIEHEKKLNTLVANEVGKYA